ncbi:MAG TPA: ankyrin repeat domain-containing protein [Chthonomonadaceae bacterium]|nr:ankyrin repeat domain-containing protein [Chthonomonadaceae bacterium]
MKKRRALLLAPLLLVGILMGLMMREYRREQASQDLIAAIKAYDTPAALAALKAGADPNTRDHSDDKPLSFSEHMKQLLDKALHPNVKPMPDEHQTALMLSLPGTNNDRNVLVKALLDAGANPNTGDENGNTPLIIAAQLNYHESLRLLLKYGAKVNVKGGDGRTALHGTAYRGNVEGVQLLIRNGADVNAQEKRFRNTPLIEAVMFWPDKPRQVELENTVHVLLDNHADVNLKDNYGKTALDYARQRHWKQTERILFQAGAKTGQELSSQPANLPKR